MSISDQKAQGTILIVDDDAGSVKGLSEALLASDYRVITAPDARTATVLLESEKQCHLIITDIVMPGGDGLALIRQLRAKMRSRRIPIIVSSAAHDANTVAKALEAGAMDFLVKPVGAEQLVTRVQRALMRGSVTVLIIDDNVVILDLVGKVVMREGFQVKLCTNAEDGLAYFEERRVDAVISDVKLPGMNGLEFLVIIKEKKPNIPVLLITGAVGQFTREDAIAAGADGYISKPFKNTEIASKLNSLI